MPKLTCSLDYGVPRLLFTENENFFKSPNDDNEINIDTTDLQIIPSCNVL